ncbi:unnamed protein product [Cylindrotheca closterium]|uniref:G-protein coupled receptors family 2 profile 2 domain-containing protein n=1 Tax=Cylindrotheca closterium TaxID=2856 RepID=A0AAD2FV88_9STRA|nr:unnamed protein product [Cylindrotheca closterium]
MSSNDNVFDRTAAVHDETHSRSIYDYKQLSDGQQKLLAILPIFSALLTIFGSWIIILMAFKSRRNKPWTPYHGLLVAMSLFEILGSFTSAAGPFLYSKQTSDRIWALGTSGTCTAIGFFNQFGSHSAMLYNGTLSIYFLLTARFNFSNSEIASRYEALMHYLCIGYPLITAFVGLFLNVYGERSTTIGCWVARCKIDTFTGEAICEERGLIEGFFGRYPVVATLAMLIFGNLLIWIHLRRQLNKRRKQKMAAGANMDEDSDSDSDNSTEDEEDSNQSGGNTRPKKDVITAGQRRALRLVSSQAFLFVGSFMLCNTVTFVLRHIIPANMNGDPVENYIAEMEIPYNNFALMVIQAILFPLQGLLNMMIYIRPKYKNNRLYHCEETRVWAIRRAIFGEAVAPTISGDDVDRNSVASVMSIGSPKMLASQGSRKRPVEKQPSKDDLGETSNHSRTQPLDCQRGSSSSFE